MPIVYFDVFVAGGIISGLAYLFGGSLRITILDEIITKVSRHFRYNWRRIIFGNTNIFFYMHDN